MNIPYILLKPLVRLSLYSYFRNITVLGKQNIPKTGPAIIVANHPSAFLDPLLIAVLNSNELHYIAGAEWIGKGIKAFIFKQYFNMIPVIRPHLVKEGEQLDNDEMFSHCYERLDKDGIILIFPEGNSITEFRLRTLKTGVARIVDGAEKFMNQRKKVKVIPIGLNYENPHVFQRDLIITVGEPVDFSSTNSLDGYERIKKMTSCIAEALQQQLWHIPNPELDDLILKLRSVLSYTLPEDHQFTPKDSKRVFQMHRDIIAATRYFYEKEPDLKTEIMDMLDSYLKELKELGISERDLFEIRENRNRAIGLPILITAPLAIPIILFNIPPYFLTRALYRKYILPKIKLNDEVGALNPAFSGSMIFIVGLAIYLIWYIIFSFPIAIAVGSIWLFILITLILHALSYFSLRWLRYFNIFRDKIKFRNLVRKNKVKIKDVLSNRKELLKRITKLKEEFLDSLSK